MQSETKRQRIIALDLLRGFFLVVILINHLALFPSPFEFISGRGNLWASAAEGFFLISGMLVGYVYTPRMIKGFSLAAGKMIRRAGVLYVWAVLISVIMVAWGHLIPVERAKPGLWENPAILDFLYSTLTLQYNYGWADFLQYYAVYMLFAPLVLWLCVRHKAWIVLLLSFLVWLFRGDSFLPAWQFLFMTGIVVGCYLPRIQSMYARLSNNQRTGMAYSVAAITVLSITLSVLTNRVSVFLIETPDLLQSLPSWIASSAQWLYDLRNTLMPFTIRYTLEPFRLVTALVWFTGFYMFFRRYEESIDRFTRGFLRYIGENSLTVYIVQAFVVFGFLAIIGGPTSVVINTAVTFTGIVLTYYIVRIISRKPRLIARRADR